MLGKSLLEDSERTYTNIYKISKPIRAKAISARFANVAGLICPTGAAAKDPEGAISVCVASGLTNRKVWVREGVLS